MPKASPIQYGFNGGKLGPRLQGRSDLARYAMGCNVLTNFIPTYQGPAVKRSGFRFVAEVKDSTEKVRLIPFEFSREQAYVLELGEGYMRVYKDSGVVLSGMSPYEITDGAGGNSLPWLEDELAAISFVQTADVIYLAHANHPPHKISRTSDTSWTCTEIEFDWPAFREENADDDLLVMIEENTGSGKQFALRGRTADAVTISGTSNATPVVVTTSGSHGYSSGDTVWIDGVATATSLNAQHYVITVTGATTFSLDGTSAPGSAGTGGLVEKLLSTNFEFTADLVGSYVRIYDPPAKFVPKWQAAQNVAGNIDARIGTATAGDQVYWEQNVYSITATPSAATGDDPPTHDKVSDGAILDKTNSWQFYNKGAGYAEITAVASDGLSCTVTVVVDFPYAASETNPSKTTHTNGFDASATPRWNVGAWNEEYGYPQAVAFYEDRLWFGGTSKDPQTMWASRTGDYENFQTVPDEDDSALVFTLASDRINSISWMTGEDVLLIGTKGGEFTADAGNADQAITPANIRVRRRSFYGSAENVQPVTVDSATLFVQRSGSKLHELIYTTDPSGYSRLTAPDLTQMSYDILQPSVTQMAYQASPFRMLWCVLSDGSLASLTYIRDEDVLAWAKHTLGGTDAKVESVAVVPHPDGDQDQLWAIVSRTIDGGTVRYVEFLEKPFEEMATEDAFFVDSGLTYDGSATTTLTGLDHLEGETVKVLGDGIVLDDATVSSGQITVSPAVSVAQVGLAMPDAQLQTMRLEAGAADGTAMGKRKRLSRVVVRVNELGEGLRFGIDFTTMEEWHMRDTSDLMDSPVPLYSGDTPSLAMPGGWDQAGRVALSHVYPLPCTLVSVMPQLQTEAI